jgi:hypothetical protein
LLDAGARKHRAAGTLGLTSFEGGAARGGRGAAGGRARAAGAAAGDAAAGDAADDAAAGDAGRPLPGLDLATLLDAGAYHTARDEPGRIRPGTLQARLACGLVGCDHRAWLRQAGAPVPATPAPPPTCEQAPGTDAHAAMSGARVSS